MTLIPTVILSALLLKLFFNTAKRYLMSNILLVICIGVIWALVIWMIKREFDLSQSEYRQPGSAC
jgi:POT family proton-dependent oligopeptide transporter